MAYSIEIAKRALKYLKKSVPKEQRQAISDEIDALASNPFPSGYEVVEKTKKQAQKQYRIRVGDYRIIYKVYKERLLVLVVRVGHRGDIYRKI